MGRGCYIIFNRTYIRSIDTAIYSVSVSPGKQCTVIDCNMRKKFVLCSGNSSKSLLIISSVHSNSASMMGGMSSTARLYE